jgi:replicative DNA helicase
VRPEDFYTAAGVVYAAAVALAEDGKPVDPPAVLAELSARGELQRVGGGAYVATLMEHGVLDASIGYHARQVAKDARRRRLVAAGARIGALPSSGVDVDEAGELARKLLDEALDTRAAQPLVTAGDLFLDVLDDLETREQASDTVKTGYIDLDHMVPIRPGQLVVVGARPGVGKSVLAIDMLRHVAVRRQEPAMLVSLEMSRTEVMHRLIAAEGRVSLSRMQGGGLENSDWDRISRVHERMTDSRLVIDDTPNAGLSHVRSRLRGMQRTMGCRMVVVDYLQLMQSARRSDNRQQEVAELTRGLKLLAREFQVPVVALAQVNRGSEHRTDKRPQLWDLRESGAIEADADVVVLLHREEMHDPEGPRSGEIDLIVAKQRQGPTGTITMGWQGHYGRIIDLAKKVSAAAPPPPDAEWYR